MYDVGDLVTVEWTTAVDGVPTNPTTQVLTVTAPDGTTTNPAVTTTSVGVHSADVLVTQAGTWLYEAVATGTAAGVTNGQFDVVAQTRYIVSLDEVKQHLRLTGTAHDDRLTRAIQAVTSMLARKGYTAAEEVTEDYPAPSGGVLILRRYPVVEATSVIAWSSGTATAYSPVDPTAPPVPYGYTVHPGGLLELAAGARWPAGATLRVVYRAGYADDAALKWAACEQIRGWAGEQAGVGSETYGDIPEAVLRSAVAAGLHPWIESMLPPRAPVVA